MFRARKLVIFALLVSLMGCTSDEVAPRRLVFTGAVVYEDGTPANPQSSNLAVKVSRSAGQGYFVQSLALDFGGRYSTGFELAPADDKHNKPGVEGIDSVQVEVTIDATYDNCVPFCRVHSPQNQSSCLERCTTGGRRIVGHRVLAKSTLAEMAGASLNKTELGLSGVGIVLDQLSGF